MAETSKKRNIRNIIDNEDEIGEVAEWAGVSAAQAKDDDDFDCENKQIFQCQLQQEHIEQARKKINQKLAQKGTTLSRRNGPLVNNLKNKAQMIALQNNENERKQSIDQKTEEPAQMEIICIEQSPEKKELKSPEKSVGNIDTEFEQANKERMIEIQKKKEIKQLSFIDAWDIVKGMQEVRESIQFNEQKSSFFEKYFGCFSVHLKSTRLMQEKNQVCTLSSIPFDDSCEYHFRILYTIYCQLMSTDYCQRYGSHWETIGFQGSDPATDLRGAGILGLLQILAFISDYKLYVKQSLTQLARMMIPFSITLINITTFVLVSLRDNKLNSLINQEDSVISVVNKLYFAGFHLLIKVLSKQEITFDKIGEQLIYIRKQIHEHPLKLIREFQIEIQKFYKQNTF